MICQYTGGLRAGMHRLLLLLITKLLKMKTLTFIAACLFSVTCFGQTKLISFRSHSGSSANFRKAVEHNLFDIGNSNFGYPVRRFDKVDTVILKANNKIIILTKRYVMVEGRHDADDITYIRDTITKASYTNFFLANSIDSLKTEIRVMYRKKYRIVNLDSTLFIGFDKLKQKKRSLKK